MANTKQSAARRRAPRFYIDVPGRLTGRMARDVRAIDLSLTGCLVRCDAALDHGVILDLQLFLAPQPLTAKVRVAECSKDGASGRYLAGLEFIGLAGSEATGLRAFIEAERRRRQVAHPAAD